MKARPKSWRYANTISWQGEKKGLLAAPKRTSLEIATPAEFGGHEGIWTPEDLFVAAVNACIMTTFLHFRATAGFEIVEYRCSAEGVMEKTETGLAFTRVTVRPTIVVNSESDRDQAARAIESAEKHCLISNSMKTKVVVEAGIELSKQGQ